jgi:hypothetical protein
MHCIFVSLVFISLVVCLFHVIESFESYTNFFLVHLTQLDLQVSLFFSIKWQKGYNMHVDTHSFFESPGKRSLLISGERAQSAFQCLNPSELMKLRKDSEIFVLKGKILSFGRRTHEIRSRGPKVCHDRRIWRSVGVNSLTPLAFVSLVNIGLRRKEDGSPEGQSHEELWTMDLRILRDPS